MKREWNQELDNYLKTIYKNKSDQEITNLINDNFNTCFTKSAINSRKRKLKLISDTKHIPKFSKEIIAYIKENHKGKSTIELSDEVNKIFGIDSNPNSIQNLKTRIKRKDGFIFEPARNDGYIKKGNIPMNKGKKWDDYLSKEKQEKCRKTTYKKGNKSSNAVDIGTERMRYSGKPNDTGYLCVKVCDGKGNKNWIPKHQIIYEKHYGKIPPKHKVIFADGNRFNFNPENLILVSNAEELIMNQRHLRFEDKELTKSASVVAKVIDKTNKIKMKN